MGAARGATARTGHYPVGVERAVEHVAVTRRQWQTWAEREPVLAAVGRDGLLREVNGPNEARRDELLAALVRLAQNGPHRDVATLVVIRCVLGGIRHRVARYRGRLDRSEAFAVFVAGLVDCIARYDPSVRPRHIANRLLSLPTGRLRRAAAVERTWAGHDRDVPETAGGIPGTVPAVPEAAMGAVLVEAVRAGVIPAGDAWLIWATRIEDMPLRHAAGKLRLGDDAARKRRRRAEQRCAAWWPERTRHTTGTPERHGRNDPEQAA